MKGLSFVWFSCPYVGSFLALLCRVLCCCWSSLCLVLSLSAGKAECFAPVKRLAGTIVSEICVDWDVNL